MHKTKLVVFDLDGTLIDSSGIICEAYEETLRQIGLSNESIDFKYFIGRNLFSVFYNDFKLNHVEALKATCIHRTISHSKTIRLKDMNSILFPGVIDILLKMRSKGIELGIATLKNIDVAKYIVSRCGLTDLFSAGVLGMSKDEDDCKSDMINYLMSSVKVERRFCLMVGDHCSDSYAAIKSGVRFVPVGYGYGFENTEFFKLDCIKDLLAFV